MGGPNLSTPPPHQHPTHVAPFYEDCSLCKPLENVPCSGAGQACLCGGLRGAVLREDPKPNAASFACRRRSSKPGFLACWSLGRRGSRFHAEGSGLRMQSGLQPDVSNLVTLHGLPELSRTVPIRHTSRLVTPCCTNSFAQPKCLYAQSATQHLSTKNGGVPFPVFLVSYYST